MKTSFGFVSNIKAIFSEAERSDITSLSSIFYHENEVKYGIPLHEDFVVSFTPKESKTEV